MDEYTYITDERYLGAMAAGWIADLESSDSRIYKEDPRFS